MKLSLAELPDEVSKAWEASAVRRVDIDWLRNMGAEVEIEAVSIVDNRNTLIYTTRDGGQSFNLERIAETFHMCGVWPEDAGIYVRRVLKISAA